MRTIDLDEMIENQKLKHYKYEDEVEEAYINGWNECLESIEKHEPVVESVPVEWLLQMCEADENLYRDVQYIIEVWRKAV